MKLQKMILGWSTAALSTMLAGTHPHTVTIEALREKQASQALRQMADLADAVTEDAAQLDNMIRNSRFTLQSHAAQLAQLKLDLNQMGRDAVEVDTMKASLPVWQQDTLDRVLPQLQDAVANAEKAIAYTSENPNRLWTRDNEAFARRISDDSAQMAHTLHGVLKVEHLRDAEQRAERSLSSN